MPNLNQNSDAELVKLLKENDMSAFDKIYRKYSRRLFQFAFGILKSGTDAEEIVHEFSELKEKTQGVINQLPERQKQIYLLSREDGLSYREIADKLSISVNTVENHMVKALRFLREKLGGLSVMSLLFYYLFL